MFEHDAVRAVPAAAQVTVVQAPFSRSAIVAVEPCTL
jgi:hypothetical protein